MLVLSAGFSFHRMGPSFERSRFGFPLILLGFTCLVIFPEDLSQRESELHDSILQFFKWSTPFVIGTIMILRYSHTYGQDELLGLVSGWIFVVFSWIMIFFDRGSISLSEIMRGFLVLLGFLACLISIIICTTLIERSSGLRIESEPLTNEEQDLVRTILQRRLGGGSNGN